MEWCDVWNIVPKHAWERSLRWDERTMERKNEDFDILNFIFVIYLFFGVCHLEFFIVD